MSLKTASDNSMDISAILMDCLDDTQKQYHDLNRALDMSKTVTAEIEEARKDFRQMKIRLSGQRERRTA